jgi:hypothetical protein
MSHGECPDTENVADASEFPGNTLNMWENDCALLYLKKEGCFSIASLWSQQILVHIH